MKRIRLISIVVAVIVFGGMAIAIFRAREPRYQGRTLTEWIEGADKEIKSEAELQASIRAVKQMAPDAIPILLKWVQARDSTPKRKIIHWLIKHPSLHLKITSEDEYRSLAFLGFMMLGSEAKPARPALIQLTYAQDGEIRASALTCLAASQPEKETLMPVLLRLIHDVDTNVQYAASQFFDVTYPKDAEAAGVYKMFPELRHDPVDPPSTIQNQLK